MNYIIYALLCIIIGCLILIVFLLYKNNKKPIPQPKTESSFTSEKETHIPPDNITNDNGKETQNTSKKEHSNINKETKKTRKTNYRTTQKMKWRDKMLDISMIPKTVELERDTLLPRNINREYGYGRRFNAFVDENDLSLYHKSSCPRLKATKKTLVHRYLALCKITPCPQCEPISYIDEWYIDFLKTNFKKFTSYEDFQQWANISSVELFARKNNNELSTKPNSNELPVKTSSSEKLE